MTAAPTAGARMLASGRRIVNGLLLAAVGIGCVYSAPLFSLLVLAIATGCLWEFTRLTGRKEAALDFPVAFAAVAAYVVLTHVHWIHRYEGVLLGATVVVSLASAIFNGTSGFIARSGFTVFGVLYVGKLLTYFIAIRALPDIGIAATLFAIVAIALTDIFAMVIGTTLGRTPLTPISPKKTVEGALGGLVVATLVGIAFSFGPWLHLTWWQGAFIAAFTSLAAQTGDLVESALKRDARVKDAGTLIAGHGGLLDRFDSYIFGGIAFYAALYLTRIIPHGLYGA